MVTRRSLGLRQEVIDQSTEITRRLRLGWPVVGFGLALKVQDMRRFRPVEVSVKINPYRFRKDSFKEIFEQFKRWRSSTGLRLAGEVFLEDTARLDREHPGWDRDGQVAGAKVALMGGIPEETVVFLYGETIAAEARNELIRAKTVLL